MEGRSARVGGLEGLGVAAVLLLAAIGRSVGFERVFVDDATVVFALNDALYHAYRIAYTAAHLPATLAFDHCIAFPKGAAVPYPPAFDLLVASVARALPASTERVAAWAPVVLGTLAVLPVWALARRLAGAGAGLAAAFVYSVLPLCVQSGQVGNVDHHVLVALLVGVLLLGASCVLDERASRRQLGLATLGIAVARAGLLVSWQGSLLVVGLTELLLLTGAALLRRRDLLLAHAAGALLSIAVVAPFLGAIARPAADWLSSVELSGLQPLGLLISAASAGALAFWLARRPAASAGASAARLAVVAAALGLPWLLLPDLREGLAPSLAFLAGSDDFGGRVHEQGPLFTPFAGSVRAGVESRVGALGYVLPFLPVAFLASLRREPERPLAYFLFAWSLVLGVLALQQYRYANEFLPIGCVGFALGSSGLARAIAARTSRPRSTAGLVLTGLVVLVLLPALPRFWIPHGLLTLAHLRGAFVGIDRALVSAPGTQLRFGERVAERMPAQPPCDRASSERIAVLSHPALSHMLLYSAGLATPANAMGPYIGPEGWAATAAFWRATSESEALEIARQLGTRYVASLEEGLEPFSGSALERLQRQDASARKGREHWGHFRLVTEATRDGVPISAYFDPDTRRGPPYKLFEIVSGAVLEVSADPGQSVVARLNLDTPSGRVLRYRARARADSAGRARLRVPYPSESTGPVRARGAWHVQVGGEIRRSDVSEDDVRLGRTVRVSPASPD